MPTTDSAAANKSRRAGLLADRIEEGAAKLAAYVKGLSDAQWRLPISATDRRTVGIVVSHVAFVYPIEVELAKTIAGGKTVPTTWKDVAQLNAGHAKDNAEVSKAAALDALARASREAAAAVRALTDQELDTAAPFGLSYGAPVTAQFVIEDHALRHSWHHLAKIQEAVGRG